VCGSKQHTAASSSRAVPQGTAATLLHDQHRLFGTLRSPGGEAVNIRTLAFVVAAALAISLSPARAVDLAKVEGGHYALDKRHSRIVFSINHLGFSTYYGFFSDIAGTLDLDPIVPAKSAVAVTIKIAGIVTMDRELDEKLMSDAFFDVAKFPTATFKSTAIEVTGDGRGKLTGDFTLHGVTKPVTLDVTFNSAGTPPMTQLYVVGFDAVGSLKRSDFGIKNFVPFLGDEVKLLISCEFNRELQAR
jgi:polyisoprenoid-binding protein YceI